MQTMGFSNTFINFIKILYTNNTAAIINSRYFSPPVYTERRLRQGCPLSLPLYVTQAEITIFNINQDHTIKWIKILNKSKEIKISQSAEDSNFYLKNQESIINVTNIFQKLNLATGETINQKKTRILLINTNITNILQQTLPNLTIKDQYDTINILGITFCDRMKQTRLLNWQIILQKEEKTHSRITFKTITTKWYNHTFKYFNTLILAKSAYLSNVFAVPDEIINKIHKIIFQHLWQNQKVEPIAKKATFLPKQKGRLNVKEPNIHNFAMWLKHLQTLQKNENQPPWMYLATYCFAKDMHNYGQNYPYIKNNNSSETITQKNHFITNI